MVAGKPPAVIFVVRHGARLDAADREWHLTSPTPYDPPLTYGGWTQCRALGARIASILLAREAVYLDEEASVPTTRHGKQTAKHESKKPKRKKHRVVIHSSPFLRCIQTSIAMAAGMSQFYGTQNELRAHQIPEQIRHAPTSSPKPRPSAFNQVSDDDDNDHDDNDRVLEMPSLIQNLPIKPLPKTKLRLDAFLGEWFSPEYYEHITPPPDSILMLASAKAELLHRGETLDGVTDSEEPPSKPNFFPGGWGSPNVQPGTPESENKNKELQLPNLSDFTLSKSPRSRATTLSSAMDQRKSATSMPKPTYGGYTPPQPRYAILPINPIPRGYVAHARDACVEADYTWDSTRPPHSWGDGGEYGEEWSAMHKRFRSGISRMINWYRIHHESPLQSHGHKRALHPASEEDTDEDCEIDTVLILVTHGAGCNALIGALTGQPVLMDVAMASLTMAVRKDLDLDGKGERDSSTVGPSLSRFSSSEGWSLSQEYGVLITASVDHLRAGTNPLTIPILQNPTLAYETMFTKRTLTQQPKQPYSPTPRYKMNFSSMVTSSPIDRVEEIPRPAGLRYGGVHRSASAAARSGGTNSPALWTGSGDTRRGSDQISTSTSTSKKSREAADDHIQQKSTLRRIESGQALDLQAEEPQPSVSSISSTLNPDPPVSDTPKTGLWPARETGHLVKSSPGLWSARITSDIPSGPPSSIPLEVSERSPAVKRRWTVSDEQR